MKDRKGRTALYCAVYGGHAETTDSLLDEGWDPNVADEGGVTPLMVAVMRNPSLEIVEKLLERKAEVNAASARGTTALMAAARAGRLDIVKALLQAGADVLSKDQSGRTVIQHASKHPEVRKLLEDVIKFLHPPKKIQKAAPEEKAKVPPKPEENVVQTNISPTADKQPSPQQEVEDGDFVMERKESPTSLYSQRPQSPKTPVVRSASAEKVLARRTHDTPTPFSKLPLIPPEELELLKRRIQSLPPSAEDATVLQLLREIKNLSEKVP